MTHLTPEEKLALSLIFRFLGAISLNLTTSQYAAIAARAPELKVLHYAVNRALEDMAIAGYSWEICSFKRGDRYYRNATSPVSMSLETVRSAWVNPECANCKCSANALKAIYREL